MKKIKPKRMNLSKAVKSGYEVIKPLIMEGEKCLSKYRYLDGNMYSGGNRNDWRKNVDSKYSSDVLEALIPEILLEKHENLPGLVGFDYRIIKTKLEIGSRNCPITRDILYEAVCSYEFEPMLFLKRHDSRGK